jgi:hypothetical protein
MARQIAIGDVQQFFESIEIGSIVHYQNRHNPQPYSVVKKFIYVVDNPQTMFFSLVCTSWFRR